MVCKYCNRPIVLKDSHWFHKEGELIFCFNVLVNRGKRFDLDASQATPLTQSDVIKQLKIHGL